MSERISVVIAAYNEELRLPPTLREIELYCKKKHAVEVDEVVIVSDGSVDRTVERAQYFIGRIPGLRIEILSRNSGKWAALHHGMGVAKNDWVLLLDADGSASISELARVKRLRTLWGVRMDVIGKSALRKLLSWGYRRFSELSFCAAAGTPDCWIHDMQCPWKLVQKSSIGWTLIVNRFAGDIELALAMSGKGENIPVQFTHKKGSKVPWTTMFAMVRETREVVKRARRLRNTGRLEGSWWYY